MRHILLFPQSDAYNLLTVSLCLMLFGGGCGGDVRGGDLDTIHCLVFIKVPNDITRHSPWAL